VVESSKYPHSLLAPWIRRFLLEHLVSDRNLAHNEAGPFGFWLLDRLVQDDIEAIVVPPSLIPVESGNKVKTDKRDNES
jgi:transposase